MTEAAGEWRRDPTGRNAFRFWDGSAWTDNVSSHGVRTIDPYTTADAEATSPRPEVIPLSAHSAAVAPPPLRTRRVEPRSPTASRAKTIGAVVTLVGGLLAALGTVVPIYGGVDVTYWDINSSDYFSRGALVAGFAIVIAFIAGLGMLRQQSTRIPTVCALALSIAVLAIVLPDYRDFEGLASVDWTSGITLCLIGAIASVVGSVVALVSQSA
jgi:hypothetical protein